MKWEQNEVYQQGTGCITGGPDKRVLHGPTNHLEGDVRWLGKGLITYSRVKNNQDIKLHM